MLGGLSLEPPELCAEISEHSVPDRGILMPVPKERLAWQPHRVELVRRALGAGFPVGFAVGLRMIERVGGLIPNDSQVFSPSTRQLEATR